MSYLTLDSGCWNSFCHCMTTQQRGEHSGKGTGSRLHMHSTWSGLVTLVFTANTGGQGEMSQCVIILVSISWTP